MAKQNKADARYNKLAAEIRNGQFHSIYLLAGEEAFYPDLLCREIIDNCVDESAKDFNEVICYGADVNADTVISTARQFPMMSERVLVVVKEAQMMKSLEALAPYCEHPLDSTVLVIVYHGGTPDKRKALYKTISKNGVILESPLVRDYELPSWIGGYCSGRGLEMEPGAESLLAEYVGCNLSAISIEIDKLLKALPEGSTRITIKDIEENVGISRQFSIFELSKALCYRQADTALRTASYIGNEARFALPPAISVIYNTFSKILRYEAMMMRCNGRPTSEERAAALSGVNPYFYKDYEAGARNFPISKTMQIISLLCEYDYLGKGGDGVESKPGELLVELVAKILTV